LVLAALIIPVKLLCSFVAAHNCMSSTFAKQTGKGVRSTRNLLLYILITCSTCKLLYKLPY